jgi:hypothetical protein
VIINLEGAKKLAKGLFLEIYGNLADKKMQPSNNSKRELCGDKIKIVFFRVKFKLCGK